MVTGPPGSDGEILFVLGAARSGTTLMGRLLSLYFDFGIASEGHWVAPIARRLPTYGDLSRESNRRRLIRDLLSERAFRILREERFGWSVDVREDEVAAAVSEPTYAGVVHATLQVLAFGLGRSRAGTKHPGFAFELPIIDEHFGERARYLAIVRDGRDVALSTMKQPWGQKSWYANARLWTEVTNRIDTFAERAPADRFLRIRYEDLLADPEGVCRRIEGFLGIPLPTEIRGAWVDEISSGARRQNREKWRPVMSRRDHRLYESVAGHPLERHGYERLSPGARARAWERAWYMALEYGRRARRKAASLLGIAKADVPTRTDADAPGS